MALAPAVRALGAVAALALAALVATVGTRGEGPAQSAAHGPLDGMAFVGKIGPEDEPDRDDVLYFNDGHFWSAACTKCGFAPGVYWVRHVDRGIEFRGVLESPERGRFSYRGFVRDGRIEVAINWRRDRWYWSIDRDLVFEGRLAAPGEVDASLQGARRQAAAESADPDVCPS